MRVAKQKEMLEILSRMEILHLRSVCPGQLFRVQNFFGGFQKTEYFWGYEDFEDIFSGSSQN